MEKHIPLFNLPYLQSVWARDYEQFKDTPEAQELYKRLINWAAKDWQNEAAAEAGFVDVFFKQTWGYFASGEKDKNLGFTLQQKYPVKGAGQGGGTGSADIAMGFFGRNDMEEIPQIMGEFKDDRSGLDKPQANRPNKRSPVEQCLDYLREARTGLISHILPTWGLVTDMNEFRLYHYGNKAQYQLFIINPSESDSVTPLLAEGEEARFHRFLFHRIFHSEWLLTTSGKSKLEKLLDAQIIHEQALEKQFYLEYHAFRESIYESLRELNPQYEAEGCLRRLVRYTQRILDRFLFILYSEDMGQELNFPPNILRDVLIEASVSKFYNPDTEDAWNRVKMLFASMRDGTPFGAERINRFNGGLFDEDPEMDALKLPNRLFCEQNQGQSQDRLLQYPNTLLYFSSKYNFGATEDAEGRTLTLTAMGRIFEQSITDLEVMEADAENRESLTELTKRKRDGVYYTPEWVTHYIVEETVGARLAEIRQELGFDEFTDVTDEQIREYLRDKRKSRIVARYRKALNEYSERLNKLKVVDPACGSGAFLIQAFKYLYNQRQWIAKELERITRGDMGLFDMHTVMRAVLSDNLYGVDINAESVEISRLALWLYTALPDRPLTSLDQNIRCGNSLIGHDFYQQMNINRELFGEDEQGRVNTFDWVETFPKVFEGDDPGFDSVVGNPPYVTFKHFRHIQKDVSEYLLSARQKDGVPLYESTQTGTFDLYLPFIERGIGLLNKQGKMGYIAPSLWFVSEYGKGLRQKVHREGRLDRWIDFKGFQVFKEAITYTALQFYSGSKKDSFNCYFAPDGDISGLNWHQCDETIRYEDISPELVWNLTPKRERIFLESINTRYVNLGSIPGLAVGFRGVETGADKLYHFNRIGPRQYCHAKNKKSNKIFILEDEIMRPLISGPEAMRYIEPETITYVIFPYEIVNNVSQLYSANRMKADFPNTWRYFSENENDLRARDKGKMNNKEGWYGYTRPMNLEKMDKPKLGIAETVKNLAVFYDSEGRFATNNVRVGGILPQSDIDAKFLQGILNAPVCNFVFKRIAKVKEGGYFEANKQFLYPLPIPNATGVEKSRVANQAKNLQALHTKRRDLIISIAKRLDTTQCENDYRDEGWLWANVKSVKFIKRDGPPELTGRALTAWAIEKRERLLAPYLEYIDPLLRPGVKLSANMEYGELKLLSGGVPIIEGVFPNEDEAEFITAQWRQKTRNITVTEKFDAQKLVSLLLKLRKTDNPAIKEQVISIDANVQEIDRQIELAEADINRLAYSLYKLTEEEIRLVENDG